MAEGFGFSFAPTADNAMDAARQGQLEGLPAAIKILSLRMPRFLGARGIAPDALLNGHGAGGEDPFASTVMQSLLAALTGGAAQNPVIIPGTSGREGGALTEVPAGPTQEDNGFGMQGPEQRPRRIPRGPGSIIRGNPL